MRRESTKTPTVRQQPPPPSDEARLFAADILAAVHRMRSARGHEEIAEVVDDLGRAIDHALDMREARRG